MAKKARIFDLPQTRGSFQVSGAVVGCESNNFFKESVMKNGKSQRTVSFGVKYNDDDDVIYVRMIGREADNVYYSRPADKAKGIQRDSKAIPWADRYNFASEGYRLIGSHVGLVAVEDEKGHSKTMNETLAPFDACAEIAAHLKDGLTVNARGQLEFSQFKGEHRTNLNVESIYRHSDFVKGEESRTNRNLFTQGIVFQSISPMDDGRFSLIANVVDYSSIEEIELIVESASLAKTIKKNIKPYTFMNVWGHIENKSATVVVKQEDSIWGEPNPMKATKGKSVWELVVYGVEQESIDTELYSQDKMEEAIAKIAAAKEATDDYGAASPKAADGEKDVFDEDPWG